MRPKESRVESREYETNEKCVELDAEGFLSQCV